MPRFEEAEFVVTLIPRVVVYQRALDDDALESHPTQPNSFHREIDKRRNEFIGSGSRALRPLDFASADGGRNPRTKSGDITT
jgi:hypothetical protein